MKFNWGTGIAIVLTVFIGFILTLVFLTSTADSDLVAADYYKQELAFQERVDAAKNGRQLDASVIVVQNGNAISISCDPDVFPASEKGFISFYRPDDPTKDRTLDLDLSTGSQDIPTADFISGLYQVRLSWTADNADYEVNRELKLLLDQ
jgi:nitrogen fixation protein FixH